MLFRVYAVAICLLMALCVSATAETFTLGFDSLPSQQGWTYRTGGTPIAETSAFSVANGRLVQTTYGLGLANGRNAEYERSVAPASNGTFRFDITASCTAFESWDWISMGGMCFSFATGSQYFALSIMPTAVLLGPTTYTWEPRDYYGESSRREIIGLDNTGFHSYTLTGTFGSEGSYSFYRDGQSLASGAAYAPAGVDWTPRAAFGDENSGANANGAISQMSFSYTAVPEPSSMLCLAGGLGIIGVLRRRK